MEYRIACHIKNHVIPYIISYMDFDMIR